MHEQEHEVCQLQTEGYFLTPLFQQYKDVGFRLKKFVSDWHAAHEDLTCSARGNMSGSRIRVLIRELREQHIAEADSESRIFVVEGGPEALSA